MSDDIERIDAIVGKFIEYARTGGGDRAGLRVQTVEIQAAVDALRVTQQPRLQDQSLRITTDITPGLRWRGDPLDLSRMLANLAENAIRYGRSAGSDRVELAIAGRREGDACLLRISDRGPGVAPQDRDRLLRPFARQDPERSERGGSGLGLAIVARLAARYRGQCLLEAGDDGIGLRVLLRLPDADQSL